MKFKALILVSLTSAITASAASAVPVVGVGALDQSTLVQPVASWQYHRNCGWQGGRYIVDLGAGRIVSCRPNRPSREYSWRSFEGREGWYSNRRKTWHDLR